MEDTKPKGMGLLKQAPVVRWIVVGGGMVPASGQIYPKEKGPLRSHKPALSVFPQWEKTPLFSIVVVGTSPCPLW